MRNASAYLYDADASRQAILDGLSWLGQQATANEEVTATVFYCDHPERQLVNVGTPTIIGSEGVVGGGDAGTQRATGIEAAISRISLLSARKPA
jgi:hypothetical protein